MFGYMFSLNQKKGISLVEIVVSMGILSLVSFGMFSTFSLFNKDQILNKTVDEAISLLEEAKSSSVFLKQSSEHSVHFEENKVVLFKGLVFSVNDPENKNLLIDSRIRISAINLAGGGSDVSFSKITGKSNKSGNVVFSLASDPAKSKTITIYETGVFERN